MDKKKIPRIDRLKFHDLQYAKTADAQKRATQSSSYQPREINLRQEKAQKKVMVQRIKSIQSGASIQNSLESKRAYEKALKGLPSKNIPYEQRVTKFNAWVEKNRSILQDPTNYKNAQKLIETEKRIQTRASRKAYEQVKQQYNPSGDYEQQSGYLNKFISENKTVLSKSDNFSDAQQFFKIQEKNLKELNRVDFEKAKKSLKQSSNYKDRIADVNLFVEKNKEVLSRGDNFEKTQSLLKDQEKRIERLNRKEFEKVSQDFKSQGTYGERVENVNQFIEENKEVLGRGKNYQRASELLGTEQSKLKNYEDNLLMRSGQEFNKDEFTTYDWNKQSSILNNPEKYDITYHGNGKIKSIKAKPKKYETEYRTRKGRSSRSKDSTYIPRELFFDTKGNITKEVTYKTYTDRYDRDSDSSYRKNKIYKSSEKIYGGDGILRSYNEWDDYDKYNERDGKQRSKQEKVYLEEQRLYDVAGNLTSKKQWNDIQTDYDKFKGGYQKEREVYLNREYDYVGGTKINYPSPNQEFTTYALTQDEVRAAKKAERTATQIRSQLKQTQGIIIRDPKTGKVTGGSFTDLLGKTLTSEESKLISRGLVSSSSAGKADAQLKDIQSYYTKAKTAYSKAGLTKQADTYDSLINEIKVNKLISDKSKAGKQITTKDIKAVTGTLNIDPNILQSISGYNTKLKSNQKLTQDINKLIQEKGGREGITAGELGRSVGGLGNLMPDYSKAKTIGDVKKLGAQREQLLQSVSKIDINNRESKKIESQVKQNLKKQEAKFFKTDLSPGQKMIALSGQYSISQNTPKGSLLLYLSDSSKFDLTKPQQQDVNQRYGLQSKEQYLRNLKGEIESTESQPEIQSFYDNYYSDPTTAKRTENMLAIAEGKEATPEILKYQEAYNKINKQDLIKLQVYSDNYNQNAGSYKTDQEKFISKLEQKQKTTEQLQATRERLGDFTKSAKERDLTGEQALYEKGVLSSRYKELSGDFAEGDIWKEFDAVKDDGSSGSKKGIFFEKMGNLFTKSEFRENTYEEDIKKLQDVKKFTPKDREILMVTEGAGALGKSKWKQGDYAGAIFGTPFAYAVQGVGHIGQGLISISEKKLDKVEKFRKNVIGGIETYEGKLDQSYQDYIGSRDESKTNKPTEKNYNENIKSLFDVELGKLKITSDFKKKMFGGSGGHADAPNNLIWINPLQLGKGSKRVKAHELGHVIDYHKNPFWNNTVSLLGGYVPTTYKKTITTDGKDLIKDAERSLGVSPSNSIGVDYSKDRKYDLNFENSKKIKNKDGTYDVTFEYSPTSEYNKYELWNAYANKYDDPNKNMGFSEFKNIPSENISFLRKDYGGYMQFGIPSNLIVDDTIPTEIGQSYADNIRNQKGAFKMYVPEEAFRESVAGSYEEYHKDPSKFKKNYPKITERIEQSLNYDENQFPQIDIQEKNYKKTKNILGNVKSLLNLKAKVDESGAKFVKGAGEYFAYKPDSVATDIVLGVATARIGTVAGISGKAGVITGRGLMASRGVRVGGKAAMWGLGGLYAGSVGLEVGMAPKGKRAEVLGAKAAQFALFAGAAKGTTASIAGFETMGLQNTNLRPFRKIARYKLRGDKNLIEFKSPVKITGLKNPFKTKKTTNPLSLEFQKPIKINKLSKTDAGKIKEVELELSRFKQYTTSKGAKSKDIYKIGKGFKKQASTTKKMKEYSPNEYADLFGEVKVIPKSNIIPKMRQRTQFKNLFETGQMKVMRGEKGEIMSQEFNAKLSKQGRNSYWQGDEIIFSKAKTSQKANTNVRKEMEFYKRYKPKEKYKLVQEGSDYMMYKSSSKTGKFGVVKTSAGERKAAGELFTKGLEFNKLKPKEALSPKEYKNYKQLLSEKQIASVKSSKIKRDLEKVEKAMTEDMDIGRFNKLKKARMELQRKEANSIQAERDARIKLKSYGDYYQASKAPIRKKPSSTKLESEMEIKIGGKEYLIVEPKGEGRQAFDYKLFKDMEIPKSAVEKGTIPTYEKTSGIMKSSLYSSGKKGDMSTFGIKQKTKFTESVTSAKAQTVQTGIFDAGMKVSKPGVGPQTKYGELKSGGRDIFKGFKSVKGDKPFFEQKPSSLKLQQSSQAPIVGKKGVNTAQRIISDRIGVKESLIKKPDTYYRGVDNFELGLLKKTGELTPHGKLGRVWITPSKKIASSYGKNLLKIKIDPGKVKGAAGRSKLKYTDEPIDNVKILRDISGQKTQFKEIVGTSKLSKPKDKFIFETSEVVEARLGVKKPSGTFKGLYEKTTEKPNADLGGVSSVKYAETFDVSIRTNTPKYEVLPSEVKGYSSFGKDFSMGLKNFAKTGKVSFGNAFGSLRTSVYEPIRSSAKKIKEKTDSLANEISGFKQGKSPSQDFLSKVTRIKDGSKIKLSQKQVQTTDGRSETIIEATQSPSGSMPQARQFQRGKMPNLEKVKGPGSFTLSESIIKPKGSVKSNVGISRSIYSAPLPKNNMPFIQQKSESISKIEKVQKPREKYGQFVNYQTMPNISESLKEMSSLKKSQKPIQRNVPMIKERLSSKPLYSEKYSDSTRSMGKLSQFSEMRSTQKVSQKVKQKQIQQLQQRYVMDEYTGLGDIGEGFDPGIIDIPPIPPKIKKPLPPPPIPFRKKKERKKPKRVKFKKGYNEREFKVLNLLGEQKRAKQFKFL